MADVELTYKGSTIGSLSDSGSLTLETAGKYCEADIGVQYTSPGGGGGDQNPTAEENDVIFIDYDGTIRYSYSAAEFASLSALPDNPTHNGLTAQGWNWTLADAKAYVAALGGLCIGQHYITTSGATEVDLFLAPDTTDGIISLCINGEVEIDFGDGSTPQRVTGTSLTTKVPTQHNWPAAGGLFTYKVSVVSGSYKLTGQGYNKGACSGLYWGGVETDNRNADYSACVRHVRIGTIGGFYDPVFYNLTALETVTIPAGFTDEFNNYFFSNCYSLQALVLPLTSGKSQVSGSAGSGTAIRYSCSAKNSRDNSNAPGGYSSARQLRRLYIPPSVTGSTGAYGSNYSLDEVFIPEGVTTVSGSAFANCYALPRIIVPSTVTTINANAFQNCFGMREVFLKPTTPPTLSNVNAFSYVPSTCIIWVPYSEDHSVLAAYQAATNWSTYASQMQEVSQ